VAAEMESSAAVSIRLSTAFVRASTVVAALLLASALLAGETRAHPDHDRDSIRSNLLAWANGVARANADALADVLAEDFDHETFFGATPGREAYLAQVASGEAPLAAIDLRHATYAIGVGGDDRKAVVGSILGVVMQTTRIAVRAELERTDDVWRIRKVVQEPELPAAVRKVYPEQLDLRTVEIAILDAGEGTPVPTRVHVEDAAGRYWAPEGHVSDVATGWREDVGRDVVVAGKTFAYVPGRFQIALPAGLYSIEVERGFEYTPKRYDFEVDQNGGSKVEIELARWSKIRDEGWYSGDTHVHFMDPHAGLAELRGEDLNVLNILASKWGELITNVEHFTGAPSAISDPEHVVFVGEETRHGYLGHAILLGIESLVYPLTWGGPSEGVPGGFDHPPMATQADAAHRAGGLVAWAHFPWPKGELAVDVALGKVDSVDLLTWGDAFSDENVMPAPAAAKTWYRLLNCGFDLPATAGTDKMYNTQVSGSVRTYVKVEGDFDYVAWLEGIRAGRTFVSTAPILTFSVAGREVGERLVAAPGDSLRLVARVRSRIPVERIEIVAGGRVVARATNDEGLSDFRFETDVRVEESTWIAARANAAHLLPHQPLEIAGFSGIPVMAHTSPVYVDVADAPRRSPEDARVLAGWIEESMAWVREDARFLDPSHRAEMLALFERAHHIYRNQFEPDS